MRLRASPARAVVSTKAAAEPGGSRGWWARRLRPRKGRPPPSAAVSRPGTRVSVATKGAARGGTLPEGSSRGIWRRFLSFRSCSCSLTPDTCASLPQVGGPCMIGLLGDPRLPQNQSQGTLPLQLVPCDLLESKNFVLLTAPSLAG
ncbi:unnamed protein product [Rangifer tarandus platyrhynchus]|uniref:Uncharacterized protein n=2 Tax=Rangifer tarandus platyrhynchus TaxID=3082113 RepID=A0ABN8YAM7_RANTA|nr:unnamed protein product [Rangifer tarandus platyrhynchus]CAI9698255.1 unnamed protein product [Rangifer tarandus platyrhynchus]